MASVRTSPPPTRIISWRQVIQDADPQWQREQQRPWNFDFSNGRLFYWNPQTYTTPGP